MKKSKCTAALLFIISALGLLLFLTKGYMKTKVPVTIGRSNGPTAIFVAGKIPSIIPLYIMLGVLVLIILIFFYLKNK